MLKMIQKNFDFQMPASGYNIDIFIVILFKSVHKLASIFYVTPPVERFYHFVDFFSPFFIKSQTSQIYNMHGEYERYA